MKKSIIAFTLLVAFSPLCMADSLIPKENRVILKENVPFEEIWIPTVDDTEKALNAVKEYLMNSEKYKEYDEWSKGEMKKINENFSKYRVQFVGKIVDGKKTIYCNFFPDSEEDFSYWKDSLVYVLDGGFWFWRIECDMETGRCLNFESNGYA